VRGPAATERLNDEVWTVGDLLERLERRDKFFVLDVRNRDEFKRFRLEGRSPLPGVNIPYFEMLELGGKDEMLDSVVTYVERDLADQIPSDLPVLAVCAKGDTSEFVAQGLRLLGYASANLKGGMKAWGEHYATRALVEGPALSIYQVSRPARGCLSYIVASAGKAIVIDPLRHLDPYLVADLHDAQALQAVACNRLGVPVACGRLLRAAPGLAQIGRMAALATVRGAGLGTAVLDALLQAARERGDREVMLKAQSAAAPFYRRAGFAAVGEPFVEAGVPHLEMRRAL